jgi:hypothetical protein
MLSIPHSPRMIRFMATLAAALLMLAHASMAAPAIGIDLGTTYSVSL